ncbi:transmembrane protein 74 [Crotalus tigris]|uniref:transmembrane protein 74 n=1 Tax=Crotalus tigris TaxID=88082 RepID=UPI00192FAF03|nr:transmembrane protein 74 [Crotalus tigris]XP_039185463.1 transmembrane protein 74 [Crotalus tigris]
MEILQITKEGAPSAEGHGVGLGLHAISCQGHPDESGAKTTFLVVTAECCEHHCKAAVQEAKEDVAQPSLSLLAVSSLSPEITTMGHFTCSSFSKGEKETAPQNACCCESETSFTCLDENTNHLNHPGSLVHRSCCQDQEFLPHPEPDTEMPPEWPHDPSSFISEEEDDAGSEAAGGKSIDYSFISAILFLVLGILLVIVSYVVPRDVTVDPSTVAAREMERLEKKSARIGAHLDRCVIAGLCLLTLGGVVLSSLLMLQMWKGELYRRNRFAASKESAKLYGSFNFRVKTSTSDNMELSLVEEEALAVTS